MNEIKRLVEEKKLTPEDVHFLYDNFHWEKKGDIRSISDIRLRTGGAYAALDRARRAGVLKKLGGLRFSLPEPMGKDLEEYMREKRRERESQPPAR
jgi:hypothetical protein